MKLIPLYLLIDILKMDVNYLFSVDSRREVVELFKKHSLSILDIRYIGIGDEKHSIFIDTRLGLIVLDKADVVELKADFLDVNKILEYSDLHFH